MSHSKFGASPVNCELLAWFGDDQIGNLIVRLVEAVGLRINTAALFQAKSGYNL